MISQEMAISIMRGPNYNIEITNKTLTLWDKTDEA
jgi:hypothetical protein